MAQKTTYTATATAAIPMEYRCSKCGCMNVAVMAITEQSSKTLSGFATWSAKKATEAKEEVHTEATWDAIRKVDEIYRKEPIEHAGQVLGKCKQCGHVEPWLISPEDKKRKDRIEALISVAILAALIALAIVIGNLLRGGYVLFVIIAVVATIFLSNMVNKIMNKGQMEMDELKALPEEKKPRYLLDKKDIKDGLKKKLEETLAKLD